MDEAQPIMSIWNGTHEGVSMRVLIRLPKSCKEESHGEEWEWRFPGSETLGEELQGCAEDEEEPKGEEFGGVAVG